MTVHSKAFSEVVRPIAIALLPTRGGILYYFDDKGVAAKAICKTMKTKGEQNQVAATVGSMRGWAKADNRRERGRIRRDARGLGRRNQAKFEVHGLLCSAKMVKETGRK